MVASSPSNVSASPSVLSKDGTRIGYLSAGPTEHVLSNGEVLYRIASDVVLSASAVVIVGTPRDRAYLRAPGGPTRLTDLP